MMYTMQEVMYNYQQNKAAPAGAVNTNERLTGHLTEEGVGLMPNHTAYPHPVPPAKLANRMHDRWFRYDLIPKGWEPAETYEGLPWHTPDQGYILVPDALDDIADATRSPYWLVMAMWCELACEASSVGVVSNPMPILTHFKNIGPKRARLSLWLLEEGGWIQRRERVG